MLTANDITSRCPVSVDPAYLVFERKIPTLGMRDSTPFWATVALMYDAEAAVAFANGGADQAGNRQETFVCAMRPEEARNIRSNHLTFTDDEVAIYRSPYPLAAE